MKTIKALAVLTMALKEAGTRHDTTPSRTIDQLLRIYGGDDCDEDKTDELAELPGAQRRVIGTERA